jgi:hypothetical protein
MQFLKRIFDFYLNSSIHVALALFSLAYVTVFSNGICRHITYPSVVFFGTVIGYNFLRYFQVFRKGKFYKSQYFAIVLICLFSAAGFWFFYFRMVNEVKIQLVIAGLMVLVYPFLRKFGILKMFWVSFVIAYITAFIFINELPSFGGNVFLEFFKRFVFVSALMIPFEIYDSPHDDQTLNTLPQKFGVHYAKRIGYFLLFLYVLLETINYNINNNFKIQYAVIGALIAIVMAIAIKFSTLERSQYYTSFWVESIPIVWLILLVIFQ